MTPESVMLNRIENMAAKPGRSNRLEHSKNTSVDRSKVACQIVVAGANAHNSGD